MASPPKGKRSGCERRGFVLGPHLETIMNLIKMQFIAGWLAGWRDAHHLECKSKYYPIGNAFGKIIKSSAAITNSCGSVSRCWLNKPKKSVQIIMQQAENPQPSNGSINKKRQQQLPSHAARRCSDPSNEGVENCQRTRRRQGTVGQEY